MATHTKEKRTDGPKKTEQHNRGLYSYIERSILSDPEFKGFLVLPEYRDDSQNKYIRARNAVLFAARKFQRFVMNELSVELNRVAFEGKHKSHSDQQKNRAMQSVIESLGLRTPTSSEVNKAPNFPFYRGKTKTTAYSRALAGIYFKRHYIDEMVLRENVSARTVSITYSGARVGWKALHASVLKQGFDWPTSGGGGGNAANLRSRGASKSASKSRSRSRSKSASGAPRRSKRLSAKK